ncbi:helix-turn-helix transcriptional regulator [Streptomyces yokosukanensis]|uniref:helix-turn-helix transcriptional regulator n=1 Tax=Streptomyces yokosukanensis TaxID=67386 RepID=UPI0034358CF5
MRIRRDRLRELRESRGMTQKGLAATLGCSRAAVSTWETTGRLPHPKRLQPLADALGVSVFELLDDWSSSTLRYLRAAAGMLQRDVAGLLNVAPSTYCDVETGRQSVPDRWVPILATTYGVSPEIVRGNPRAALQENDGGGMDHDSHAPATAAPVPTSEPRNECATPRRIPFG